MFQHELQECVSSIKQMDDMSQPVIDDIDSDHRRLILQTVARLLCHLQSVEDYAAQHEKTLIKRNDDLTAYQVRL